MKRITFTESDLEYRKGLAEILMRDHGANPIVLEVEDDFDLESYVGIASYKDEAPKPQGPAFKEKFPTVAAWLESYRGNFEFYLSLQAQYRSKGMLSEKQIACVERAIQRDRDQGKTIVDGKVQQNFTIEPGTVVVISKHISNQIAKEAGYARGHRAIEILEVEAETPKAYRVKVRLSATRTSHCGICGLTLENPQSVAAGIGPICADKTGISFSGASLDELEKTLAVTKEVVTWIPKKSIKERVQANKGAA